MSLTAMKIFVLENIPNIWELANTPTINENVSGIGTLESGTFELLLLVAFACLIRLATDEKRVEVMKVRRRSAIAIVLQLKMLASSVLRAQ